jgi:hypothetical protein
VQPPLHGLSVAPSGAGRNRTQVVAIKGHLAASPEELQDRRFDGAKVAI